MIFVPLYLSGNSILLIIYGLVTVKFDVGLIFDDFCALFGNWLVTAWSL